MDSLTLTYQHSTYLDGGGVMWSLHHQGTRRRFFF
jgi:hypothetical protein